MILVARCLFVCLFSLLFVCSWQELVRPLLGRNWRHPKLLPHTFTLLSHASPSRFHNDGRMLDVFQRLTAKEGTYFTPQDLEVSIEELSYIVKKAEQWRGFNGERRKAR